ncbi:S41 family peptidase [Flavivirga eckloniae]|uniref:Peptidase S41 protein n=1 Tax=Flavivirga eckloniae TaxID=1803846 RepID=A0A2K9PNA7_9FLAO|nr:S41 family peptidase [Flavivirga eckloniae]AUP78539.1 peptidase S41 protein [Flavivirga eckloniae]
MHRLIYNVLLFTIIISTNSNAQSIKPSKDSIATFYNSLFSNLKSKYLYKDEIKWNEIELEIKDTLGKYKRFSASLEVIIPHLFSKIKAEHCSVYLGENAYSINKNFTAEDFSEQWLTKYASNPAFEAKVLDNKYGYILIPGMLYEDTSVENVHNIAQPLYDKICTIKNNHNIKGWIIDLRFNTGGNVHPMLLALYDFLGDTSQVYGTLGIDKNKLISKASLSNGKYYENDTLSSYIIPKGKELTKTPVAIITGIVTASSGEIVALAFKGRNNTIYIGEKTIGKTTTNDKVDLPFGAYMALTVGYDCDRNNIFYKNIIPDVMITKEDNFENLLEDKNIIEAIKYINK